MRGNVEPVQRPRTCYNQLKSRATDSTVTNRLTRNQISLISQKLASSKSQFFDITHRTPQGVDTASFIEISSHVFEKT